MMTETFFKYLTFEKRLSSNTLAAYRNDIGQLVNFLNASYEINDPSVASYSMLRSWIISLTEEDLQAVSVNRKIASIRAFYKFLRIQGTISIDPSSKITVLKSAKRLPAFVREQEMGLVLDNMAHVTSDDFEGTRDKLILELFYGTGMRLSELLGLRDESFNLGERTVKVLGKRNKERVIPFGAGLKSQLQNYLAVRNRLISSPQRFFVSLTGQPCYPMLVYRLVRKHMAGTSAVRKSPHILRHSYATHLLDRGAELTAVKDLLGHSSLAATQVYTHNSTEKIKKVFNQAHPKA
jgi:integrase/recombinase XerC